MPPPNLTPPERANIDVSLIRQTSRASEGFCHTLP